MEEITPTAEIRGRDHGMSRTKDGPIEETRKTTRELHTNGLEEDQAKTSGARASAVAFRKFVF